MASTKVTAAERRKAQKTRRNIVLAIVLTVAAVAGWAQWNKAHQVDPTAKLITGKVTRGDVVESVHATGSVTAQTGALVHVGSQITGTIKELKADIGTIVKAGDPIAILNLPDLEAQVRQAKAAYDSALTHLEQTKSGVNLEQTQTREAIATAEAGVRNAQALYDQAVASLRYTSAQTPADIKKAEANLAVARAALSTAKSNLKQVQASASLQIATANFTVTQNQATYKNAVLILNRNKELLRKEFVAQSVVDNAEESATVAQAQLASSRENVNLVKASVEANLQSAKDGVTQAQRNVDAALANLDVAKAEPFNDAQKKEAVKSAQQALDQARSTLKNANANKIADTLKQQDIQQAEELAKQARATYDYNLAQQDKSVIRAPINGTVLNLAVQQGETLAAGLSSPTVIIVADLTRLQIDAYVDETDIGKIKLGQEASVIVDAYPKHSYKGRVAKIASGSTIQQGVVTYDVTIKLDPKDIVDPKRRLMPDMTANVTLQTGKLTNVLVVDSVAIKVTPKGSNVTVLTKKDGKPVFTTTKVSTGGSDESKTEIRKGVNEGDTVVLAGMDNGRGGMGPQNPFGPRSGGAGSGGGGARGGGGGR